MPPGQVREWSAPTAPSAIGEGSGDRRRERRPETGAAIGEACRQPAAEGSPGHHNSNRVDGHRLAVTNSTGQAEPSLLEPVGTASPCLVEPEPDDLVADGTKAPERFRVLKRASELVHRPRHLAPLSITSEPGRFRRSCLEGPIATENGPTRPAAKASWSCLVRQLRRDGCLGRRRAFAAET